MNARHPATRAATLAALLACGSMAFAQYAGPSTAKSPKPTSYASVAEILKNPVDDIRVTLQGTLVSKVGHEKYLFSDGTGQIRVEIDDDKFPKTRVDEKTRVTIEGEVEKDLLQSPEIDVKRLTASPASTG
jgi:uncharacterized protein (TIGR00156 family)